MATFESQLAAQTSGIDALASNVELLVAYPLTAGNLLFTGCNDSSSNDSPGLPNFAPVLVIVEVEVQLL